MLPISTRETHVYVAILRMKAFLGIDMCLDALRIQSQTRAGAIVLLCDYILANDNRRRKMNLYESMQESLKECEDDRGEPFSDDEKFEHLISYFFDDGGEIVLKQERTILLAF